MKHIKMIAALSVMLTLPLLAIAGGGGDYYGHNMESAFSKKAESLTDLLGNTILKLENRFAQIMAELDEIEEEKAELQQEEMELKQEADKIVTRLETIKGRIYELTDEAEMDSEDQY